MELALNNLQIGGKSCLYFKIRMNEYKGNDLGQFNHVERCNSENQGAETEGIEF